MVKKVNHITTDLSNLPFDIKPDEMRIIIAGLAATSPRLVASGLVSVAATLAQTFAKLQEKEGKPMTERDKGMFMLATIADIMLTLVEADEKELKDDPLDNAPQAALDASDKAARGILSRFKIGGKKA